MTGEDEGLSQALQDLQASRERLLAVVAGVTEEQFKRRPAVEHEEAAGNWSIAEVLAHLLASEQRQGERLEALLAGRDAAQPAIEEPSRTAEARQGRAVPVPQIIHGLLAARRHIERMLGERTLAQSDAGAASEGVHRLLRDDVIEHEGLHTAQIERVKAVLGAVRRAQG